MSQPEKKITKQALQMLSDVGFLHLKNVKGFDEDDLLATIKEFHALPDKIKHQMKPRNYVKSHTNNFRGWFPFLDNDVSHKEFFDMGAPWHEVSDHQRQFPCVEETPFPKAKKYEALVKKYNDYWYFLLEICLHLLDCIAVGLGKKKDYFREWFQTESLSTFRSIHYLPRSKTGVKTDKLDQHGLKLITPEHSDTGFITLLSTFMYPGLQVEIKGKYRSVKPEKNHLVVNLGTIFARITNYKLKATKHRVLDIGRERFSCPFFLEPKFDVPIPADITVGADGQTEPPIQYGVYNVTRLRNSYGEWKGLKLPGEEGYVPKDIMSKVKRWD